MLKNDLYTKNWLA